MTIWGGEITDITKAQYTKYLEKCTEPLESKRAWFLWRSFSSSLGNGLMRASAVINKFSYEYEDYTDYYQLLIDELTKEIENYDKTMLKEKATSGLSENQCRKITALRSASV